MVDECDDRLAGPNSDPATIPGSDHFPLPLPRAQGQGDTRYETRNNGSRFILGTLPESQHFAHQILKRAVCLCSLNQHLINTREGKLKPTNCVYPSPVALARSGAVTAAHKLIGVGRIRRGVTESHMCRFPQLTALIGPVGRLRLQHADVALSGQWPANAGGRGGEKRANGWGGLAHHRV